jgi:hypothetical protein
MAAETSIRRILASESLSIADARGYSRRRGMPADAVSYYQFRVGALSGSALMSSANLTAAPFEVCASRVSAELAPPWWHTPDGQSHKCFVGERSGNEISVLASEDRPQVWMFVSNS